MSAAGSVIRDRNKVIKAAAEAILLLEKINGRTGATSVKELADCYRISDNCLAHALYLEAIRYYIDGKGRSRGSYLVTGNRETAIPDISVADLDIYLCRYDREVENKILEICFRNDKLVIDASNVREIPSQNLWFETVWKDYLEDNYLEG
jgi:hypothetical protein